MTYDFATKVERADGNTVGPGPDLRPKFDELVKQQQETNRLLRAQGQGRPGPVPPVPVPPAKGAAQPKRP